ncbi:MAG: DUF3825 domain-containing protein [Spirochaetaceae bacterium]|nr:DUF3825 domain-containing protein [Spirochaetaceae bacterium]
MAYQIQLLKNFAVLPNWEDKLGELITLANTEDWTFKKPVLSKKGNEITYPILRNYLDHTFNKVKNDYDQASDMNKNKYFLISEDIACFDTGLFTKYYERIFAFFEKNRNPLKYQWVFIGFKKESDHNFQNVTRLYKLPERANYFSNVSELIYDYRLPIQPPSAEHVLEDIDNFERIPIEIRNNRRKNDIYQSLVGAVKNVEKRLAGNYKIAIPQYFQNKIQLLIPIDLGAEKVNLALALNKYENYYSGRTLLTLEMAYNNARLIVKPESDWLLP